MTTAVLRPGISIDDQNVGVWYGAAQGRFVGIVAPGGGESGKVFHIQWERDALQIFGEASRLPALVRPALRNGAAAVKAVSAGSGTVEEYRAALATLEREELAAEVCAGGKEIQLLLKESVERASSQNRERVGVAACEEEALDAWAAALKGPRMVLLGQRPVTEKGEAAPGALLAAALAGRLAGLGDPAVPLNGISLNGIVGLAQALGEEEVDGYIRSGLSPLEKRAGRVEVIRAVTGQNGGEGFQDVNLTLVTDRVLRDVREAVQKQLTGIKNTAQAREALATQAAVVLEEERTSGLITRYVLPRVSVGEGNPDVCLMALEFTVQRGLNQIRIQACITA